MENIDFETHATRRVWCRTARAEKDMQVNVAEAAVARGLVDLVGPGALPVDTTLRPGDRTLGDGEGCAFIEPRTAPGTVIRVTLVTAQRMVVNGLGRYVSPDGHVVVAVVPTPDREPVIVADDAPEVGGIASKVRRAAGRLASGTRIF